MGIFSSRYSESESSGGSQYIDWGKAGVDKQHIFQPPKNGSMLIDIVPYVIATDNHPLVRKGVTKVGGLDYIFDIWVHRKLGPAEVDVVCPKRNYQLPCPACDLANEYLREKGNKSEEYIATKAKRRAVYNILNAQVDELDLFVFEVSHWLFEKELIDRSKYEGRKLGLDYLDFADPDEGYTIECRTSLESDSGFEMIRYKDFRFEERGPDIITPDLIDDAVSFDRFVSILSPEEIEDIIYADAMPSRDSDDEEEEEEMPVVPRRKRSAGGSRKRKAVVTEEENEEEEEKPATRKRRAPAKKSTPKPTPRKKSKPVEEEEESEDEDMLDPDDYLDADDEEDESDIELEEEDDTEEEDEDGEPDTGEDEEEKPPKKPTRTRSRSGSSGSKASSTRKRSSKGSGPAPKKSRSTTPEKSGGAKTRSGSAKKKTASRSKKEELECPAGYEFGVDTDQYEECDDCAIWDKCAAALKENTKE